MAQFGNHFMTYVSQTLCCTPEIYTALYVNYISIKLEEERERKTRIQRYYKC